MLRSELRAGWVGGGGKVGGPSQSIFLCLSTKFYSNALPTKTSSSPTPSAVYSPLKGRPPKIPQLSERSAIKAALR